MHAGREHECALLDVRRRDLAMGSLSRDLARLLRAIVHELPDLSSVLFMQVRARK